MSDNVRVVPSSSGTDPLIATDDVGGVQYQRIKPSWGPDGTANEVDNATGKRLPVEPGMDPLTPAHSFTSSVGTSTTQILASNPSRKYAFVINVGTTTVWIRFGTAAVLSQSLPLYPGGGGYEISKAAGNLMTVAINGIVASGTGSVAVLEGT